MKTIVLVALVLAPRLAIADDPPIAPAPAPDPAPAPAPPPATTDAPAAAGDDKSAYDDDADNDADDTGVHKAERHHKKKKHKTSIKYKARKGITIKDGKTSMTFFAGVETVLQEQHCVGDHCEFTDGISWHVRRARFAVEAKLPGHLKIDFAIQVKNENIVLKQAALAWKDNGTTLKAGFLKPPGGIERDSSTWIKAFPERSVVANFKQDRILGLMATQWWGDHHWRVQAAAGKPPAGNFDAFEPEDVVLPPAGIEPEDLTTDPGNWDVFLTGTYEACDNLEISLNSTAHIAPDAGRGPNFSEPYETNVLTPRFIKGAFLAGGADVSWHSSNVRLSAEGVAFHSGTTIPHLDDMGNPLEPTKAERGLAGYVVLGITPDGKYGKALDNSPLEHGWQWLLRGEFLRASPGEHSGDALFMSGTTGLEWQKTKNLRLQVDVAVQKYNDAVTEVNRDAWRVYSELWAQVIM